MLMYWWIWIHYNKDLGLNVEFVISQKKYRLLGIHKEDDGILNWSIPVVIKLLIKN